MGLREASDSSVRSLRVMQGLQCSGEVGGTDGVTQRLSVVVRGDGWSHAGAQCSGGSREVRATLLGECEEKKFGVGD